MQITVSQPTITDQAALAAVAAAVAEGRRLGKPIVCAVVDAGGNLMACLRASGAFLVSTGIAQDKAYTAAAFGQATSAMGAALAANPILLDGIAARDRVVLFGGGLPIVADGQVIGGIGCSGGSEDDDTACARAGLAAIGLA